MRAATYARVSTDKQSADSPADQIARCREFAARRGWHVVDALVNVAWRCMQTSNAASAWRACSSSRSETRTPVDLSRPTGVSTVW
jgi:predicted site-specific integrase-resolvase